MQSGKTTALQFDRILAANDSRQMQQHSSICRFFSKKVRLLGTLCGGPARTGLEVAYFASVSGRLAQVMDVFGVPAPSRNARNNTVCVLACISTVSQ